MPTVKLSPGQSGEPGFAADRRRGAGGTLTGGSVYVLIVGSDSNSSAPCPEPPVLPPERADIFDLPMTGAFAAFAAFAACGIGRGGAFTFETGLDLAAGRAFALAALDFGRAVCVVDFFLALPFTFVGTDRFLFICL
ncbi:MAG TPA: hypothetical protein VER77_02725 [Candidatus Dormibacteraeota bacterium]|nr:hypothetical protein [Candidatus Dormibacteraeota bacterium]